MPESCSDLGVERHPFAVVPKEVLDEALARVEELEAALRGLLAALDAAEFTVDGPVARMSSGMDVYRQVVEAFSEARALLKDGER